MEPQWGYRRSRSANEHRSRRILKEDRMGRKWLVGRRRRFLFSRLNHFPIPGQHLCVGDDQGNLQLFDVHESMYVLRSEEWTRFARYASFSSETVSVKQITDLGDLQGFSSCRSLHCLFQSLGRYETSERRGRRDVRSDVSSIRRHRRLRQWKYRGEFSRSKRLSATKLVIRWVTSHVLSFLKMFA